MSRNYITTAADGSATVRRKVPPLGLKPSVGMTGCGKRKVPPLGLKPSAGMTGCGKRKVPPLGLKPSVGMTGYGQTQGPSTRAKALGRDDRVYANACLG